MTTPRTRRENRLVAEPQRGRWFLRVLVPAAIILAWLTAAAVGGPYFGRVSEVSSNEQTDYLPASSAAYEVQNRLADFSDDEAVPAVIVFTAQRTLSEQDRQALDDAVAAVANLPGVGEVSPVIPSEDGLAAQAFAPITAESEDLQSTVSQVREALDQHLPPEVTASITGPAGFLNDLVGAFSGIDGLLLLVTLIAVFVILILVYRSLLLPIAVLATSVMALTAALLTVWWLAKAGIVMLSGQIQGILFILVIGAATDYSLLYVSRFREELRTNRDKGQATRAALRGSWEPIVASGGTVIVGLLCLLLSDLKSNSGLGPVGAIGIVFAMLAAFTLLPSILFTFGRAAFWPRSPHYEPDVVAAEQGMPRDGFWPRTARFVRRHSRPVWITVAVVLLGGAALAPQLQANGVPQSELVLTTSEARDGQTALGEHFPAGAGSPIFVITPTEKLQETADVMLSTKNIDSVAVASSDSPSGSAPVTSEGITAFGGPGTPPPTPTESRGQVLLQGTLTVAADSDAALDTIRQLRSNLNAHGDSGTLVGGVSATALDTNTASIHDRTLIIPLVLAVILIMLMLLLRSVVAPILLVLTTVLSFGTAMGVAAVMFTHVFGFPGADAAVPLFGFIFLVALGIDYNIFLMTRVREETLTHGTHDGVTRGLAITGGVITSAGVVLAATFAALSVIPVLFLVQIAFIVAFGVLLDTFIVRSLLVPALVHELGRVTWWPSRLARRGNSTLPSATQQEHPELAEHPEQK